MEPAAGPSDLPGWLRFRLWALLVAAAALAYVATTPFFAPFMEGLLRRKSASIPLPVVLFARETRSRCSPRSSLGSASSVLRESVSTRPFSASSPRAGGGTRRGGCRPS